MVVPERETDALVTGAQAGNSEDFAMLVQLYERQIYGYLSGLLRDRDEAWDLAQVVFMRAWQKLKTLKEVSRFQTWLYAVARNAVYDYWRTRKEIPVSWEQLEMNNIHAELPGPEEWTAEAELVQLTLAELSSKARDCLLLRVIGGFSHQEIADIVGIGKTSVSTYISAARRQFRAVYSHLQNETLDPEREQAHECIKI